MLGPKWSNFPKWMNQYVTYFLWTVQIFGMQNIQSCEKGNKQYKLSKEIELTFKIEYQSLESQVFSITDV